MGASRRAARVLSRFATAPIATRSKPGPPTLLGRLAALASAALNATKPVASVAASATKAWEQRRRRPSQSSPFPGTQRRGEIAFSPGRKRSVLQKRSSPKTFNPWADVPGAAPVLLQTALASASTLQKGKSTAKGISTARPEASEPVPTSQHAPSSTPPPAPNSTPQPTPSSLPEPTPSSPPQPAPSSLPQPTPSSPPQPTPSSPPQPAPSTTAESDDSSIQRLGLNVKAKHDQPTPSPGPSPGPSKRRGVQLWDRIGNVAGAAQGKLKGLGVTPEVVEPLRPMTVARLAHGLDRVLFNPGVHWLRDPRTGVYNFSPSLRNILDPDLFDYEALPPYITSSQDKELETLAKREGARYCGSTSSLTALLSHCYFLISGRKPPDLSGFSEGFKSIPAGFTMGASLPASIKLVYKPAGDGDSTRGVYAIDADKSASGELENSNFVLAALGKSMEKMLTVDDAEFRRYGRVERWKRLQSGLSDPPTEPEAYHYTRLSHFLMRSQLDCYDPRLPNKTFDLKTRAVIAVRQDRANWVESSGYQIRSNLGLLESFEREYYDMIRAAFLKYGFQARIGNMDGIFVAYHNTREIFGFQYVPLSEIFTRVFGTVEMGEQAFRLSVTLLEAILDSATAIYPNQTLSLSMHVGEGKNPSLSVFVEPSIKRAEQATKPEKATPATAASPFGQTIEASDKGAFNHSGQPLSHRSVALLNVKVDRYLDGTLIENRPVDFTTMPGRNIVAAKEDEIVRRQRQKLAPLNWSVDYVIQPRSDLSEEETRKRLDMLRAVQISISSLTPPNLEAVAARDVELEAVLRATGGEEAVERWREERRHGKIGRMPRAPGQAPVVGIDVEADTTEPAATTTEDASGEKAEGAAPQGTDADASSAPASSLDPAQVILPPHLTRAATGAEPSAELYRDGGEGLWATNANALRRVKHLRQLARLGARDRLSAEHERVEQVE